MAKHADAQVNADHQKIITMADSIFNIGDYLNAKAYYQYIIRLYPENQQAKARLDESINLIHAQRSQRIIYANFIIEADNLYQDAVLEDAVIAYGEAGKLFPFETYPKSQIEKIDHQIKENRLIREEYESVIKTADTYFSEAAYKNAKIEYQFAISLLPKEEYPKSKLVELNKLIADETFMLEVYDKTIAKADSLFLIKSYKLAIDSYRSATDLQPTAAYPKAQITQINILLNPLEAYNKLLEQADNYYLVRDFTNAKNLYKTAAQTKPTDNYPIEMLNKVEQAIASKATTDQEDYENAVKLGDTYFINKEFRAAQQQFEFANRIHPEEDYSKIKLDELAILLDSLQKSEALNEQFSALIGKADIFFSASEFNKAKKIYIQSLEIKPEDSYAKEKLKEIENIFSMREEVKNLEASYASSIEKAEAFLNSKDYDSAKSAFEHALSLKSGEEYPVTMINQIDSVKALIEAQQSAEENYKNTIQQADDLFNQKKFGNAQMAYQKALNYKPDEDYPNSRLTEIGRIFQNQKEELDRAYELAISNAKNEIARNQLQAAKVYLNEALSLKPDEFYPAITILQIDTQIEESKARALLQYEPLLKEADEYFKQKSYDRALSFYYQASALLPNEIYPASRIKEIIQIVNDATSAVLLDSIFRCGENKIQQFNFDVIPVADRKSNYFLLKLKNADATRNFKIYFNYGQNQQKNGGLIIRLNQNSDSDYYLIRIGSLYKWFSEDNNWISIQPEGGEVEISEISISKIN